jgi:hypothetical protein
MSHTSFIVILDLTVGMVSAAIILVIELTSRSVYEGKFTA